MFRNWLLRRPYVGAALLVSCVQIAVGITDAVISHPFFDNLLMVVFPTAIPVVALYRRETGNLFFENPLLIMLTAVTSWLLYVVVIGTVIYLAAAVKRRKSTAH